MQIRSHCKYHHAYAGGVGGGGGILCKFANCVALQTFPPLHVCGGACSGRGLVCISGYLTHLLDSVLSCIEIYLHFYAIIHSVTD